MPPCPADRPILGSEAAAELWLSLAPGGWPLPWQALPAGTALVGGAVRDGLLGRLGARPDLDLVVGVEAIALCRQLAERFGGHAVVLDQERSIARLVIRGWTVDLARQVGDSLEDDLRRRDFRLNALALPLAAETALVDPTGGLGDLRRRQVVAVSEANLLDDPLRLLRGVRLASQLDFSLEESTLAWIHQHHGRLREVAPERVLGELEKLAASPLGHRGLALAGTTGLLQPWTSAAPAAHLESLSRERAFACGLTQEEANDALPLARLAALCDGAALDHLRSSRKLQGRCGRLRRWRQRLGASARQAAAALGAMGEAERLALHRQLEGELPALALQLPPDLGQVWMARWRDPSDPLFHPRSPLDGRRLQHGLGLAASPQLGALIDHLTLERAFGRLGGEAGALAAAQRWLVRQTSAGLKVPRRD
ncbi:CCA tRNA nucleotidyltransferase [Cyanobium sp. Morenito 9A2]|uniref:CCA tRNA nucleotidyltransferase n=1 Tax=Cyanobium sp. Morenito 9A2 TaxID=2823718 RepID=UPI0020CE1A69|nr:CCA tRNA nucleotidyltransferase [Cyanobium sp. Morenito 9A2]MCP9849904.1 CCA tRNA nucleotidyltransferase [Cyanobium sp. Morenito 9A2]